MLSPISVLFDVAPLTFKLSPTVTGVFDVSLEIEPVMIKSSAIFSVPSVVIV